MTVHLLCLASFLNHQEYPKGFVVLELLGDHYKGRIHNGNCHLYQYRYYYLASMTFLDILSNPHHFDQLFHLEIQAKYDQEVTSLQDHLQV